MDGSPEASWVEVRLGMVMIGTEYNVLDSDWMG